MEKDWALMVSINKYPLAGINPLDGAVRDAHNFFDWVTSSHGGDVPTSKKQNNSQAILLTSPSKMGSKDLPKPVFSEIQFFFERMLHTLDGETGRRLYIYLSGHGISPVGQMSVRNAALLMANSKPPNFWHNFPGNIWAEGLRSAAIFREVVLIMDCCRDLQNNAYIIPHIFGDPVIDSKDCHLAEIYATSWASKAREGVFPPNNEKQGFFTYSLLEVLKAGKMNGALLKESVIKHMEISLGGGGIISQTPDFGKNEELEKIIFNENIKEVSTSVTIKGHSKDTPFIEQWLEGADSSSQVTLDGWTYDGFVWIGMLPPGFYFLQIPNGSTKRFRVLAGSSVKVEL